MTSWTNAVRKHYRWVIVAAGGLLGCVAIGALFSLPVLLRPIALDTAWSTTGISAAMTIAFVALAVGSMGWGALSDRIGPRVVVMIGSLLLTAGLALASLATSLLAFQLLFGAVVGLSAAAIFAPLMACVTGWFDTRRSLAVSLVSAGMGWCSPTTGAHRCKSSRRWWRPSCCRRPCWCAAHLRWPKRRARATPVRPRNPARPSGKPCAPRPS
jgi:MFS family permease